MFVANYWFQLIWLFTGGVLLAVFYPKKQESVMGIRVERWRLIPAILLVIPYIIAATLRTNQYGDTLAYRNTFLQAPDAISAIPEYLSTITKDKGFAVLNVILKSIIGNSDGAFLFIIATFQMLCLALVYRKYSCNYWLSIFIFVAGTDYMSWCHNGIRQFLAITIIMLALPMLLEKKYMQVILIVLFASTFHASALLMLPVVFIVQGKAWNKKSVLCIISCIVVLFFVDQFTNTLDTILSNTQYSNMVTDWKEWEDDGTNPIRDMVYSIPMILSIIGYRQIRVEDDPITNMMVNFGILTSGIAIMSMGTSGIFMGRLISYGSVYSASILLPWEIKNLFTEDSSRLMIIALILGYICFFYYQMHFTWAIL